MITIPRLAKVLRKVLESEARELARSMGVIQRERKLTGATLVLLLVLGWLHQPQAGSSALARFAGTLGITISKQGIEEHWTYRMAEWLYEVLLRAVSVCSVPRRSRCRSCSGLLGSTSRMAAVCCYPMGSAATGEAAVVAMPQVRAPKPVSS